MGVVGVMPDGITKKAEIHTPRFLLRELAETDVTKRYLGWFRDSDATRFITAAAKTRTLSDLADYVRERVGRLDVVFLGIFEKTTGRHIGNIKYEPVNADEGYAIMGILIGEPAWRGKGVTAEVLTASAQWLKAHRKINQILLGVSEDNPAAIRAYGKVGFVVAGTPHIPKTVPGAVTMVWRL
jgi:ribosomal-protein-alanine N-acetyltransferase